MCTMFALLWFACTPPAPTPIDPPREVPWARGLPPLSPVEGRFPQRVITHLHSPWSHDACDGDPLPDGQPNAPCLQDLRDGLCDAGIDVAFVTDHPAHAAAQEFAALTHAQPTDQAIGANNRLTCDDGRAVEWAPGIEDELMPLGLDAHVPGDAQARDDLYNRSDPEALTALTEAGAAVFVAHTEGKDLTALQALAAAGLTGVEVFNLHAMFAPDIREEHLGLDGLGWVSGIAPFTAEDATAEPDLFVLGVLDAQPPSLERWDALLADGPMVGIVGTDAHQNVLPIALADGERADSYRRMLRWMANLVLADAPGAAAAEQALRRGESWVAFEILGTPDGYGFDAVDGTPTGGSAPAGAVLRVGCPVLHADSPRGPVDPTITVRLLKDGALFAEGCGQHPTDGPGAYRVEVWITPEHLRPFLGDDPDPWIRPFPWLLSNAIRVE
jgi:hypothetical protein